MKRAVRLCGDGSRLNNSANHGLHRPSDFLKSPELREASGLRSAQEAAMRWEPATTNVPAPSGWTSLR